VRFYDNVANRVGRAQVFVASPRAWGAEGLAMPARSPDEMNGLPPLYAGWMAELLDGGIPVETEATCESCAMCGSGVGAAAPGQVRFDPRTKCCTYLPTLPNFLVGAVLADEDPAAAPGRRSVGERIARGIGVTPLGLARTRTYDVLYDAAGMAGFGRNLTLRCPHYVDATGGCGIWRHRNSVCTTWFCKHGRGVVGERFWGRLRSLLAAIEHDLSLWCVLELGLEAEAVARLIAPTSPGPDRTVPVDDLDGRPDPQLAAVWGSWHERKEELYVECARRTAAMTWADVARVSGPKVALAAQVARAAHRELTDEGLPSRAWAAAYHATVAGRDTVRLRTYSSFDPIELPRELLDVLPSFDGRPIDDVLHELEAELGISLTPALVRRLLDFAVLVGAQGAPQSS
jgi:hypothetical protein